jgi:hypothetical protein
LLLGTALYHWSSSGVRYAPEAAEVAVLRKQLAELQKEFEDLSGAAPDQALVSAPSDGLVIGVPTALARDVAQQIVAGYLGSVRLTLRDKQVKTKRDDVEAKVLFATRKVGSYELQTRIVKVTAALRPTRELRVSFEGQRFGFNLPVALSEGHGRARLTLAWDSKGIADLVCGDVEVSRELEGRLVPAVYPMSGHFDVAADGGSLLLRPNFQDNKIRVRIEATEQAWRVFDELVESRSGLCQRALEKGNVKSQLREILAEGFDVRLPRRLLRDIRLPASVQESLKLADGSYVLKVAPAHVAMNAQWIWYGTDVTIERAAPGAAPGPAD